jgi:hypothetical protein
MNEPVVKYKIDHAIHSDPKACPEFKIEIKPALPHQQN